MKLAIAPIVGILIASGSALAQGVELSPLTSGLDTPSGMGFHEPSGSLVVATGGASSLVQIYDDAAANAFGSSSGMTGDRFVETVRSGAVAFQAGDVFTTNGQPGEIARMAADGTVIADPWVTLPAGNVRGLHVDRTGLFGGDLIAVTDVGGLWRIDANGDTGGAPFFATTEGLAGCVVVPDDPRYGGLAGRIVAGTSATTGRLYSVDPSGASSSHAIGVPRMRDIDIVSGSERLYGVDRASSAVLASGASDFAALDGEILVTQATFSGTSGMHIVTWPFAFAIASPLALSSSSVAPGAWGSVAFGTLSAAPVVDDPPADESEYWLVFGRRGGSDVFMPSEHSYLVQVARVAGYYEVDLESTPEFELVETEKRHCSQPCWRGARLFDERSRRGILRYFTVQAVGFDPGGHPDAPEVWSHPLHVVVLPNGNVLAFRYGSSSGMEMHVEVDVRADGSRVLRFPIR